MRRPVSDAIENARAAALDLHKALLDATRVEYERDHGPVPSPGMLLRLVSSDPAFAWLRGLSELIVAFDQLLAMPEIGDRDAAAVRVELEDLLSRDARGFRVPYLAMLQLAPEVVLAHSELQRTLKVLPAASLGEVPALLLLRRGWNPPRRRAPDA